MDKIRDLVEEIVLIKNKIAGKNQFLPRDVTVEINLIDDGDGLGNKVYSFAEIFATENRVLVSTQGSPEDALLLLREKVEEQLRNSFVCNN